MLLWTVHQPLRSRPLCLCRKQQAVRVIGLLRQAALDGGGELGERRRGILLQRKLLSSPQQLGQNHALLQLDGVLALLLNKSDRQLGAI